MDVKQTIVDAERELKRLGEERVKIERREKALSQLVEICKSIAADESIGVESTEIQGTLTQAIREIVQRSTVPLTPPQIRDFLTDAGYSGSTPKNLLITVHTILQRLVLDKQIDRKDDGAYAWISPQEHMRRRTIETVGGITGMVAYPLRRRHYRRRRNPTCPPNETGTVKT